jgi:flagellar FliL protein
MEEQTTPEPAPAPPKKKRGFGKLLLIVIPMLLIAGGGGWWYLAGSGGAVAAEEASSIEDRGVVPFETFLVNLSDPGGNRFLKATIQVVVESEAEAKHVEENAALMSHARSAILELLTEQNAQALVTTDGKKKLKEAIAAAVATVLKKQKVLDVLFSEFVVQF